MLLNEETAKLDHYGRCPTCNASWDAGDIFTVLRKQDWSKDKTDEELREYVRQHYSPPYKFSYIVGVQLPYTHPNHYDGVSYWQCPYCRRQWSRFKEEG